MPIHGAEVILQYGNGASVEESNSWTDIATLVDIPNVPQLKADDIDTSHMLTPGQVKTFDPGWADAGECSFVIQYDKTQNAALYNLFREPKGWQCLFPDGPGPSGSKWKFDGYINGFTNAVDREGIITAEISIKISGEPTFDPA
jgi:hypothetical protein